MSPQDRQRIREALIAALELVPYAQLGAREMPGGAELVCQNAARGHKAYAALAVLDGEKDLFDDVWGALEEASACDGKGGCEYQRIRAAWEKDLPSIVLDYVRRAAAWRPPA